MMLITLSTMHIHEWLKLYHTYSVCSNSSGCFRSSSSNSDALSDLLSLPKPPDRTRKQRKLLHVAHKLFAILRTVSVLEEMKDKQRESARLEQRD